MAENKKQISEYFSGLPENSSPSSATYLVVEENGVTKKIPIYLFIHKDDSGNVDVSGLISVSDGATFGGAVDIKYGEYLRLHSEDNTKYTDIYCDDEGNLIGKGDSPIATEKYVDETVASILSGGSGGSRYSEGLTFELLPSGTIYSVTGIGTCTDAEILIPPTYNGLKVNTIGTKAFSGCSNITKVVMPDTITTINQYAFENCSKLTSITLSKQITSIQKYTFSGCLTLESIEIPKNVTSIGEYAFDRCYQLTSVFIHSGVTSIGRYAFMECDNIYCEVTEIPAGWDENWKQVTVEPVLGAAMNLFQVNDRLAEMGTGDSSIIDLGDIGNHKDAQQTMVDYVLELPDEYGCLLFKYYCNCYCNACFAIVYYYHNVEDNLWQCRGTVYDNDRFSRRFAYDTTDGFYLDGCWEKIATDDGGSGGATLSMPRIRFVKYENVEMPLYDSDACEFRSGKMMFSVHIQDGTLQEGDQLQVCAMRVTFGERKLRPILSRYITSEDLVNISKQPYIQITTDDASGNNLAHDSIMALRSLYRTDSATETKRKPKYIRIRRPIYKDGEDVNALFSNVVPVYVGVNYDVAGIEEMNEN